MKKREHRRKLENLREKKNDLKEKIINIHLDRSINSFESLTHTRIKKKYFIGKLSLIFIFHIEEHKFSSQS